MRLDIYVTELLKKYSRAHVKKLIDAGLVTVDGEIKPASYQLRGEEDVKIRAGKAEWTERLDDWIIHEDKELIVLDKPAGLLMHPLGDSWLTAPEAALDDQPNLAGLLQRDRPPLKKVPRCGIVHRLDRQTSGVLLVAKTKKTYEALVEGFKEREMSKTYRAVVRGVPGRKLTRVDAPIGRNPGHRRVLVTQFGKDAQTAFKVLEAGKDAALVEAKPLTGRTHQIRAHLAFMGHPVAGDPEFDKSAAAMPPRTMLHAYKIEFEGRSFSAPPPKDFRDFWRRLKTA